MKVGIVGAGGVGAACVFALQPASGNGSVWRIVHDAGVSFIKNAVRRRAGPARRGMATRALEGLPRAT